MPAPASPRSDFALLLLRLALGLQLLFFHGWAKLTSAYAHFTHGEEWRFVAGVAELGFPLPRLFALASALTESLGAVLLAIGLFPRYAAFFIAVNMAVAVFRHLTLDGSFELAVIYFAVALLFVLLPPGRYSLDSFLRIRPTR